MVAPFDSKVSFEAEGETITLRLNFRSVALADEKGIDLLFGKGLKLSAAKSAMLVKCLAVQEHPGLTEDQALAMVARNGEAVGVALVELFARAAAPPDAEDSSGNAKGRKATATA